MSKLIVPHRRRLLTASAFAAPAIVYMLPFANTLTRLIPDLYAGMDVVSRELVGVIPGATRNTSAERAAVGQPIVWHISAQKGTFNVTPAMAVPEPSDTVTGNNTFTITKSKGVEFGWTGEEQRGLNNGGAGYLSVQADNFAQALRTLVNEMEVDLCVEAAANASRATGTAGTTPFAADIGGTAQVRKILDDNGAPGSGRSLIIDTTAGAALRTLNNLTRVNEAGTSMGLRDGELLALNGLSVKESAGIQTVGASTAASSTTNNAGYAKGATVITLAAVGTGLFLAGSQVTFAGDTNRYTIAPGGGDADVSNGGTITLCQPGLRQAIPASNTAISVVAAHTANFAFSQGALHIAVRPPALPQEGDLAMDRMLITDPRSGMTFEVAIYPGYRKVRLEVVAAWGVKAVKPAHIAELMG